MTSSPTEQLVDVTMPQMGVSVAEGTVVEWRVAPGEAVAAEQTICEISTDKIDTEVPAPASGVLAEIVVQAGETVDVGTVLARIGTGAAPAHAAGNGHSRHYSPVVTRIAAEHHVDLAQVTGTGRDGRVRKQDVLAFLDAQRAGERAAPAPAEPPLHIESPYRPEPAPAAAPAAGADPAEGETLSRMRRQIGAHMKRSLDTAATCTTWMEADMGRVEAARRALGTTALPLVARAAVEALREFPALNATLDGERYRQHDAVHLGIAVSLGEDGLIVPVIRDAQELSAEGLAVRIRDLAARARAKQLTPDDVAGGTFTITNPGQYGSLMATPVINQPQVAILDLEAVVKRPIVVTDDEGNDMIAIRPQTVLGLSWDHRALDGVLAAQFLGAVRRRLESWEHH
ncbi:dihydrolipoamide acetyltransferase family protein [Conexibacter woesei]|uniref:Dihydrolipoamide acetyltransferase component of pyruvate dehydrogenase complex n=1 Tax=Conexibacter woesei (strain DSM 14684 / CCUG 47730 / CIP 108061 / JCM 11494 / NBRC 100937 / ID131577) TaxID=469383 RepID=D3FAA9_CONWI|nr:dihydrolipoamide acetyltransferase family protein [Conexibacter woesei]ADB49178.1 catalytic domain of components of various dehydrogenase complexes [Conexibacter woesei DSM 14684]